MRWADAEAEEQGKQGREGRRARPIMRRLTRPIDGLVGERPKRKEEEEADGRTDTSSPAKRAMEQSLRDSEMMTVHVDFYLCMSTTKFNNLRY